MQKLSSVFEKNGWEFWQIKRNRQIAIFEKSKPGATRAIKSIEVVRIKGNKEWECHGSVIPARESYPSSESWGRDGFTVKTMESAEERFSTMMQADAARMLDTY